MRLLEAAGYEVFIAAGRKCCGRTLITGGQANKAGPWIDHNVALLAPYAKRGIPIVGVEPSCILTLRDEYLDLASDRRSCAGPGRAGVHVRGIRRAGSCRPVASCRLGNRERRKPSCTATVITKPSSATHPLSPSSAAAGYKWTSSTAAAAAWRATLATKRQISTSVRRSATNGSSR